MLVQERYFKAATFLFGLFVATGGMLYNETKVYENRMYKKIIYSPFT